VRQDAWACSASGLLLVGSHCFIILPAISTYQLVGQLNTVHAAACRNEEARMQAEEAKLEKLRRKIADHELQIVRGQMAVHEYDLNGGFVKLGGEDSDESDSVHSLRTSGAFARPDWYSSVAGGIN
jgi:hypothetical protein